MCSKDGFNIIQKDFSLDLENLHNSSLLKKISNTMFRKNLFLDTILISKTTENSKLPNNNQNNVICKKVNQIKNHSIKNRFVPNKKDDEISNKRLIYQKNNKDCKVYNYLYKITGAYLTQTELIYLRKTFFKDVLPPMTRDEQRSKIKNIECLETFPEKIIPILEIPVIKVSIQKYIFHRRI